MRRPNATQANSAQGEKTNALTLTPRRRRLHVPEADGAVVTQERRGLPILEELTSYEHCTKQSERF